MSPLDSVNLRALMQRTSGRPEIAIGLVDGPVATHHPDLSGQKIREISGKIASACQRPKSSACMHGTFVAGILCARRNSLAPAICPGCTLIVRPIFAEEQDGVANAPSASAEELAAAIVDAVDAGARIINLSAAVIAPSRSGEDRLEEALTYSSNRG